MKKSMQKNQDKKRVFVITDKKTSTEIELTQETYDNISKVKHPEIQCSGDIKRAILDPDAITADPERRSLSYYRQEPKYANRHVRVVVIEDSDSKGHVITAYTPRLRGAWDYKGTVIWTK